MGRQWRLLKPLKKYTEYKVDVEYKSHVEENLQYIPEHCIYYNNYNRNKYNIETKFSSTVQAGLKSQNSYTF